MTDNNDNDLIAQRRNHLQQLREQGKAYPNTFRRNVLAVDLHRNYGQKSKEEMEQEQVHVCIAGRMMTRRIMGKVVFAHIQDMSGQIQLYVKKDDLAEGCYADFKKWDLGDIVGAEGTLMKTNKGELSVQVNQTNPGGLNPEARSSRPC